MHLNHKPELKLDYPDLRDRLVMEDLAATPDNVFEAVCSIRSEKLPDPSKLPNAGSFFKNPIVTADKAKQLRHQFRDLPVYPLERHGDRVKLSAAWLIDKAGLKQMRVGNFEVSEQHALVIVNLGGGHTTDLLSLIERIQTQVYRWSSIYLELEPGLLPPN